MNDLVTRYPNVISSRDHTSVERFEVHQARRDRAKELFTIHKDNWTPDYGPRFEIFGILPSSPKRPAHKVEKIVFGVLDEHEPYRHVRKLVATVEDTRYTLAVEEIG